MRLVVNTNILFSFFNERSAAREIATLSSLELYAPQFALDELTEHKNEILKKFSLSDTQFLLILRLLEGMVNFIEIKDYAKFLPEAYEVSPDPDDIDFFALAFKLGCHLWSNDKRLKKQSRVQVFSTTDLTKISDIKV